MQNPENFFNTNHGVDARDDWCGSHNACVHDQNKFSFLIFLNDLLIVLVQKEKKPEIIKG
jgi:hypothetical protein